MADPQQQPAEEIIRNESPEGRPANPDMGKKSFGLLLLLAAFGIMLIALILALIVQPIAAIVAGVLGLVLFAVNPEVWTGLSRGSERDRIMNRD